MKIVNTLRFRDRDSFGSGAFGASRSHKGDHQGVDIVVRKNDYVYAPFSGTISKYGWVYSGDLKFRYIEITGSKYVMRIMYAELDTAFDEGDKVPEGQFLGVAQNIAEKYSGITPHLHIELRDLEGNLIDPTNYLKKKV